MSHTGNKYHREIRSLNGQTISTVDVYSVLRAFKVTLPGIAHAAKKLLCAGIRGKASQLQDLVEACDALIAEIQDQLPDYKSTAKPNELDEIYLRALRLVHVDALRNAVCDMHLDLGNNAEHAAKRERLESTMKLIQEWDWRQ